MIERNIIGEECVPRLTNTEYLKRRKLIQALYEGESHVQVLLGHLTLEKQQILHYYYATAKDNLTEKELIEHRKWCDKNTALRLGKSFALLYNIIVCSMRRTGVQCDYTDTAAVTKKIPELSRRIKENEIRRMKQRKIGYKNTKPVVVPVARAEIDVEKLGRAIWMLARQLAANDPERKKIIEGMDAEVK